MPTPEKRKYTDDEIALIIEHNTKLILSASEQVERFRQLPKVHKTKSVLGQMYYWEHVVSALRWSTGIAQQMRDSEATVAK